MSKRDLKVLFSDLQELLVASIQFAVSAVVQAPVTIITPPTIYARDLLACAEGQHLDLVILFAGNIVYDSRDRSPEGIERSASGLVRELVTRFKVPVVVLYVYPDSPTFPDHVLEAGAAAVIKLPFTHEDFAKAIKPCLPAR